MSLVDRATKYTLLKQVDRKTAEVVCRSMIEMLGSVTIPSHTITADNGKEFADHARVSGKPVQTFSSPGLTIPGSAV